MANRLQDSLSPYLLQHAHNPVDWFPWDDEALNRAKAEDKPIFLSIGYSACHWCHVMERECFEDLQVARALNRDFIPVKVDREERPDLDAIYMDAVQALTGRGGWPMSVWLTPELKPFFGGTYFPKESRGGLPGFLPLLERIVELWSTRRDDLEAQAAALLEGVAKQSELPSAKAMPGEEVFAAALDQLRRSFDPEWGGFGGAPKFPQPMALELILRRGSETDRAMAVRTLDAMWEGGLYDHLGGGFARYSVDHRWLVPHFEKMLYDNALLARCYLWAHQATGEPQYAEIARGTLDYLVRDLRDSEGGFHSSEDADSEGVEGKFYLFTPLEVSAVLGAEDGASFCEMFGITPGGNFEHGESVLHRFSRPLHRSGWNSRREKSDDLRRKLLRYRDRRVRPAKDDKVLASWNGLAVSAFATAAQVLGEPRYLEAAATCAGFLLCELWRDGGLRRVWRRGRAHTDAFLEDYAAVADGLVDLFETDFDPAWLRRAEEVAGVMVERFEDRQDGGFYGTEPGRRGLVLRTKTGIDSAIPSGNALAARALLRIGSHLRREDFRRAAERTLALFSPWLRQAPRAFMGLLNALDLALADGPEIVVAGACVEPGTLELVGAVHRRFLPNRILSAGQDPKLPLHEGRFPQGGRPAAYVCRNRACAAAVTEPEALTALLDGQVGGGNFAP